VIPVRDPRVAETVLEYVSALPSPQSHVVYVQEMVDKPDRDIRVIVIGGRVVGAVYRRATSWRTNVATGAVTEPCPIGDDLTKAAVRAADAVGAEIAGVDVLERADGSLVVLEVLPVERTGLEFQAKAGRLLDRVLRQARDDGRLDDPAYGQRLVEPHAQVRASRFLAWRVISEIAEGRLDGVTASMSKWYATELFKRISTYGFDVAGMDGTVSGWDGADPDADGWLEAAHREGPGITLSAGTSEIMLYLVASSGLQLLS
jgi:hypothetical protein